jgi:CDP-ribitol ribitolphosphotransferase
MKLAPRRERIVFLSRQYDHMPVDFDRLIKAISRKHPDMEVCCLFMRQEKDTGAFLAKGGRNLIFILRQMKALSTARTAVIDGYSIPVSILRHREDLVVIQIWHASCAIKKMGLQTLTAKGEKEGRIARAMRMHANYTWAVCPSPATGDIFAEAFGMERSRLVLTGTPHLDYLYHREYESGEGMRGLRATLRDGKELVAYFPTYREGRLTEAVRFIDHFDFAHYDLLVRLHPREAHIIVEDSRVIRADECTAAEIISVANYVVTDYSSVAVDAGLIGVPVFFYVYDIESYRENPGLNVDPLRQFSACASKSPAEIMEMIGRPYDAAPLSDFITGYVACYDGNCTERLSDFILKPRQNML